MNEATRWRQAKAAQIASRYAMHPKIATVALAGSVARGWADHHSDIELDVYWAEPPTDADRLAPITSAGGHIDIFWATPPSDEEYRRIFTRTGGRISQLWPFEPDEWSEHYYVDGINIGISGFLVSTIENYLHDVLNDYATDDERQMRLAAIHHAVPLAHAARMHQWQLRTAHYPHALTIALVKEQLAFDESWWISTMLVEREAHLALIDLLHHMQIKTLRILLAINHIYLPDPRFKWADRLIAQMAVCPPNLGLRLKQVFSAEPASAVQAMAGIFAETLELVRQHVPEIDAEFMQRWYQHQRPVHTRPV